MPTEFDKYAGKGNQLLQMLANDLQVSDHKANRILNAVLHAIRNHISIYESFQIIARLPMILKAIYVDQWNLLNESPGRLTVSQFLDEVRACDDGLARYDFGNDESTITAIKAVFRTLNFYLAAEDFEDIVAALPTDIKKFVTDSIGYSQMAL